MKTDFIIVGSGIAGLNAALNIAEFGKVLLITKKRLIESSTNFAQGGIAAVLAKTDDFKKHVKDTMIAGCFHNNREAVKFMVKHGPEAIKKLMNLGVKFEIIEKKLALTREGGHSKNRIAYAGDRTGEEIEKTLVALVEKNPNITIWENTFALDLIAKNRMCYGVRVIKNNRVIDVFSRAVILATGGIGQIYKYTTNPEIATADGIAMAFKAGALTQDMEFIQFHPTALAIERKPLFLLSESLRGEGAILINSKGERFMCHAHKLAELAPRDIVAREIYSQQKLGPVYLDISHKNAAFIRKRFPKIYSTLKKKYSLDLTRDKIPVTPAAHYLCGGVKTNLNGETNIKNLCCLGEMACTGVHGANRLASNSLLEAMVFSEHAAEKIKIKRDEIKTVNKPALHLTKISSSQTCASRVIKEEIKTLMWNNVGILRSKSRLRETLVELRRLEKLLPASTTNIEIAEVKNMLTVARLIIEAAIKRKKSLGCHFVV
ncbi:L-aspartate oxidase [Candidatus Peregrinibacteria bacterium]|nr:L-aspartate oxidase [Candidatus Peregrinibacteria bacterium]